jgi:hypothetical protein
VPAWSKRSCASPALPRTIDRSAFECGIVESEVPMSR